MNVDLPANVSEIDDMLCYQDNRQLVLYNGGHVQGINIEQNKKLTEAESAETRARVVCGCVILYNQASNFGILAANKC